MEQSIGRRLESNEIVHHLNGDKSDNRIENLSLETRSSHNRQHGVGKICACVVCGAEKWYSPYLIEKLNKSGYKCRSCWAADGGNAKCLRK